MPGLVTEGSNLIVAPPKVGKSCFVYQVAAEVSLGGDLLGERVASGSALYFALEDGQRRGQDRLRAALAGRTMPRGRLEVRWDAREAGEGLEDDIGAWLDAHEDAALVAIDTLGRVRPKASGKQNPYDVDVDLIGRLQGLFRDRPAALVLVHHSTRAARRLRGPGLRHLRRERHRGHDHQHRPKAAEAFGTISVSGRDIERHAVGPLRRDGVARGPGGPRRPRPSGSSCTAAVKRPGPSCRRRSPTGSGWSGRPCSTWWPGSWTRAR